MSTVARGKIKKVTKLVSDIGDWVTRQDDCDVAKNYFVVLFAANKGNYAPVLDLLSVWVTQEDNDMLTKPIFRKELKHALFQMQLDKYLRLGGFNYEFYHYFSHVYGEDVFQAAWLWLEHGFFPTNLNEIGICIISKSENP